MRKKCFCFLIAFIMITVCLGGCSADHTPPKIKEQSFPFHVEFSVKGEKYIIDDVVICKFDGLTHKGGWGSPAIIRSWTEQLKSTNECYYRDELIIEEHQKQSLFKDRKNLDSSVYLSLGRADYYMGESNYKMTSAPCFYYYECFKNSSGTISAERTILTEEQLKEFFDIEIVQWSFSDPIKNSYE